jgi:hypothetical protein
MHDWTPRGPDPTPHAQPHLILSFSSLIPLGFPHSRRRRRRLLLHRLPHRCHRLSHRRSSLTRSLLLLQCAAGRHGSRHHTCRSGVRMGGGGCHPWICSMASPWPRTTLLEALLAGASQAPARYALLLETCSSSLLFL